MDGNITINIYAFGFVILCCIITAVCVFLIIALYNAIKVIKRLDKVIETNNENINKTLTIIPETAKNVNDVTVVVKENLNKAGNVIGSLEDAVAETVASVSSGTENILSIVKIASSVISAITSVFNSGKKD